MRSMAWTAFWGIVAAAMMTGCVDEKVVALGSTPNSMEGEAAFPEDGWERCGEVALADGASALGWIKRVNAADDGVTLLLNGAQDGVVEVGADGGFDLSNPLVSQLWPLSGNAAVIGELDYVNDTFTLSKVGPNGAAIWSKTLPGRFHFTSLPEEPRYMDGNSPAPFAFTVTAAGEVVLAGQFSDTLVLEPGSDDEVSLAADDAFGYGIFLARYSADGVLLNATTLNPRITPERLMTADDGTIYIVGRRTIVDELRITVAALSADGALKWMNRIAESATDEDPGIVSPFGFGSMDLSEAPDGGLLLHGLFGGEVVFPDENGEPLSLTSTVIADEEKGSYSTVPDFFMVRYSPEGALEVATDAMGGALPPWAVERKANWGVRYAETTMPDTAVVGEQLIVTVKLLTDGVFGDGQDAVTLSPEVHPYAALVYTLDGILDEARYLDVPADADTLITLPKSDDRLRGLATVADENGEGAVSLLDFCL